MIIGDIKPAGFIGIFAVWMYVIYIYAVDYITVVREKYLLSVKNM